MLTYLHNPRTPTLNAAWSVHASWQTNLTKATYNPQALPQPNSHWGTVLRKKEARGMERKKPRVGGGGGGGPNVVLGDG